MIILGRSGKIECWHGVKGNVYVRSYIEALKRLTQIRCHSQYCYLDALHLRLNLSENIWMSIGR